MPTGGRLEKKRKRSKKLARQLDDMDENELEEVTKRDDITPRVRGLAKNRIEQRNNPSPQSNAAPARNKAPAWWRKMSLVARKAYKRLHPTTKLK